MITFLQSDLSWIIAFQSLGDWLIAPMKFFSFLGTEEFYILLLPVLYWCIDSAVGLRMGVVMLLSSGLNFIVKIPFHGPRPYWVSLDVKPLWAETSFGIPSGHAQNAVTVWGTLAGSLRRKWAWALAIFLALVIGLSRAFLGAHFIQDVAAGWLLGVILFVLFSFYWTPVVNWAKQHSLRTQILAAFLTSVGLVIVGALAIAASSDVALPAEWIANAARIDEKELTPLSLNGALTSAGTLFGLLVGVAWMAPRGGWQASGLAWKRIVRYLAGLAGVFLLWYGLGALFPRGESLLPYVLRYLRYALLGLWVSAGAPTIFTKLKLS